MIKYDSNLKNGTQARPSVSCRMILNFFGKMWRFPICSRSPCPRSRTWHMEYGIKLNKRRIQTSARFAARLLRFVCNVHSFIHGIHFSFIHHLFSHSFIWYVTFYDGVIKIWHMSHAGHMFLIPSCFLILHNEFCYRLQTVRRHIYIYIYTYIYCRNMTCISIIREL